MKDELIRSKFTLSERCPFIPGEDPRERHRRRHASAIEDIAVVREWCDYRGVQFIVAAAKNHRDVTTQYGWKWDFRAPDKFAQWRPFAGKLHMKTRLREPVAELVKVYDVHQLLVVLERWLSS